MKPLVYGLMLLICLSCNVVRRPVESRMKLYAKELQQVDSEHKIRLDGVYFREFNQTSPSLGSGKDNSDTSYLFYFMRFFKNGKVYSSKAFHKKPSINELRDTSDNNGLRNSAPWEVYFVRQDTLYIDYYNNYNGYEIIKATIQPNGIKILAEKDAGQKKQILFSNTYSFMPFMP